jgi:asparagine synthase (glutamine-hydrolysing)
MCGFAGFMSFGSPVPDAIALLVAMGAKLSHRGPNDKGFWYDECNGLALVHRRLSIVDLSPTGRQPMVSSCGRYVIVFNGEIYNHLALRRLMGEQGLIWRGFSDTETLLNCFSVWGVEKTLQSVVGMFAIALWDQQEKVLTLARDRLGEKPLYWGWQNGVLLFGSELKALKVHPSFKAEIDRNALSLFLRHNYIPAPYSIFQGIQKLRQGHYVNINVGQQADSVESKPYWSMSAVIETGLKNPFAGSDTEAIDTLESQLSQSISGQMLADVPLGAFLSGGVDSSTVVAMMQQQSQRPVQTFAIGFNEVGFNEAEHAKAVAQHLGTDHTELYVGSNEALAVIPDLPKIFCEPFADSSQIPTFLVSQMAKRHVTVALSGDAGDELFGGYNPYQFAPRLWSKISKFPLPLRKLAVQALSGLPGPEKLDKLLNVLDASSREDFYRTLLSHWKNPGNLVIGATEPPTQLNTPQAWPETDSFEHWMMAMDAQTYMADDVLVKVDRAAMANSLETRVPMLDHRVVELAWRMPLSLKIRDGKGKWILREVLYKHVPRELIERPKKGFSIPLASWLRGPLRDWAEALLDEQRLQQEGYFRAAPIRKVWQEHLAGRRDHSRRLWSILMFQAWLEDQKL